MNVSMAFGNWGGRWGWRVEYTENDKPAIKDFRQDDYKVGEARDKAREFFEELQRSA